MLINKYFKENMSSNNQLINETSTYLRQHAFNPVNWYAWNAEALELSIKQDKPIMLSIGYSACHWCHVMEEESFEDELTAELINKNFIAIKVDREERPDIDDIYMAAVQLMTGHGGWPLTVFLTPEQKPFYGGTYFPKEDRRYGNQIHPGFKTVLKAVSRAWQEERHNIESNGKALTAAINASTELQAKSMNLNIDSKDINLLSECANKILPSFDLVWGGVGRAPKFPQTLILQMCLQLAAKFQKQNDIEKSEHLLKAIEISLNRMAEGGIYDQLGGGFARYSTDEKWLVPHFEKMLYDNALLAEVYLDAYSFTQKQNWKNIACETLDFIANELISNEGGFYSSLDADSEGSEGKFYIWKKSEIDELLGEDSALFCRVFGITEKGNFEDKENILHINNSGDLEKHSIKIQALKNILLAYRSKRIRPIRDDKILTSWTSLAISAFVKGYQNTGNNKYANLAKNAAKFVLEKLIVDGRLMRSYAQGYAKLNAYLDDHAYFCKALIDLSSIDADPIWLEKALHFGDFLLLQFFDENNSDFFYTANDHEKLITRPKNFLDGPIPSATSLAVLSLLKLHAVTNDQKYQQTASLVLEKHKSFFQKHPHQYASMISVYASIQNQILALVLVDNTDQKKNDEMLLTPFSFYLPNMTVFIKSSEKSYHQKLILLKDKIAIESKITAYVCQDYSCQSPTADLNQLKAILRNC